MLLRALLFLFSPDTPELAPTTTTALKERRKEIDKLDSYIYGAGTKEKKKKKKRGLRE